MVRPARAARRFESASSHGGPSAAPMSSTAGPFHPAPRPDRPPMRSGLTHSDEENHGPVQQAQALMPRSAPSRCTSRCGQLATKGGRCDDHQVKPWANPSANSRALTSKDRARIKREQLKREPQCRGCGSTEHLCADHIVEVADGGSLFDASNLQTLCEECHEIKTAFVRQQRAAERRASRG